MSWIISNRISASKSDTPQFFLAIGDRVTCRTAPPPSLTDDQQAERKQLAERLAPTYHTELLAP